jgi:crotonobetainyl-CoA:carnitine CoA-transferase CaiB-like acyl-CoA transferase
MLSGHAIAYDQLGLPGRRTGNRTSGSAPRNTYRTKDDRWIAIAGSTQALTERLFREMGRPDLISDPRFKSNRGRLTNVEALDEIFSCRCAVLRCAAISVICRASPDGHGARPLQEMARRGWDSFQVLTFRRTAKPEHPAQCSV